MSANRLIAAAFLVALLLAPAAAPLCAVGVCDPDAVCELPARSACAGDEPALRGPDCCLDMPVSAAERDAATSVDAPAHAVPTPRAAPAATAPQRRHPLAALPAIPARGGRTTLTLHRTLLL